MDCSIPSERVTRVHGAASWLVVLTLGAALVACGGGGGGGDSGGMNDTTPPTTPAGLGATPESATSVQLDWQASTDADSGVAGYRVYRNGASAPIATVTSTSYEDTGLTPDTTYSYTVRAFDGADPPNVSMASASVSARTLPDDATGLELTTERVFDDLPAFSSPVLALQAPDDASTWYVVEQRGRVLAFENAADVRTTRTLIDLRSRVTSGGETGLLGMAFHPQWPAEPRAFLSYTATESGQLVSRIAEFRTSDGGMTLDTTSERVLITVRQPASNHNGGLVAFGPHDGLLYIGLGDGGGGGDDWGSIGNGQNLRTLLGKMLRIDVNGTSGSTLYRIPDGNPHASNEACDENGSGSEPCAEIFAYGFRNPWRWSFDRATGELWVADVGQSAREELDRVEAGGNYGWRCFEGTLPFNADCGPSAGTSLPPVAEYGRDAGRSITGGYVYRGNAFAALRGRYVFGDFLSERMWNLPNDVAPTRTVHAADGVLTGHGIVSFAEDIDGELYLVDYAGTLHRVVVAPSP